MLSHEQADGPLGNGWAYMEPYISLKSLLMQLIVSTGIRGREAAILATPEVFREAAKICRAEPAES